MEKLVRELRDSDPEQYENLNPKKIADRYMTIFIGAIGLCELFHSVEPIKNGIRMARELVE